MTGGPQDGATVACDDGGDKVLGSAATSDLRVTAANVAGTHARLQWTGRRLLLEDSDSATGTFVNGEKIFEPYPLSEGDRVYLGPPGSSDSVSLLVCPPVEEKSKSDSFLFDPAPAGDDSAPLVLDEPGVAPAFDFLSSSPSPAPAREEPKAVPAAPEPAAEPIKLKPQSPPSPARKPTRAEYTSEMPSIGGDRVREPVRLPPASPRGKPGAVRKSGPSLPIPLIAGGAVLLVAALGAGYLFFGRGVPPVLDSVDPLKSEPGGTVALTGQQFAADAAGNTVFFGDKPGQILSASATQISAKVPADAAIGEVPVSVKTSGGRSSTVTLRLARAPQVSGLEPPVALPGAELLVRGARLNEGTAAVTIGGRDAEVLATEPTALRVRVPADLPVIEGKSVPVSVTVGGETAKPASLILGRLPLITELSPAMGAPATKVTVRGLGFAPQPTDNVVRFGDTRAVVLAAKPGELLVVAPGADRSGSQLTLDVRVETGGAASSPRQFMLTRASSGSFTPRFYPQSVSDHPGHDHVLISTDIGPLLVLSGPGGAPSTAQRALLVAEGLNALVDATLTTGAAGSVEAREKPEPCLAVVGAPGCLATVTAADVAAYDEKWGSEKGARPNPRLIAGHWAALVEDHLLLFLRKQRPYRLLETSTRGKVLLEIYAEAVRKVGAGNGVPAALVSPVPMKWAGALRDAALVLPAAEGATRGAAAIEGLWVGTAQDGGSSREIRVRFQLDSAGKPVGSLTTKRGKLSMDVPLTDIAYAKGSVRFVAVLSGQPTSFNGVLEQGAIKGTLQVPGKAAGQFTLSFVE